MAMAICSEYTPVKSARGRAVHALPFTTKRPACGKPRPRAGWRITSDPFNCLDCMAVMVRLLRKRGRAEAQRERETTP